LKANVDLEPASLTDFKNVFSKLATISTKVAALTAYTFATALSTKVSAKDTIKWEKITIPVRETLFDITFDPSKPLHGWIVGAKGTFLETFDGIIFP
jgi:photosystem II stability/assembly factor-like uncharacterized protein